MHIFNSTKETLPELFNDGDLIGGRSSLNCIVRDDNDAIFIARMNHEEGMWFNPITEEEVESKVLEWTTIDETAESITDKYEHLTDKYGFVLDSKGDCLIDCEVIYCSSLLGMRGMKASYNELISLGYIKHLFIDVRMTKLHIKCTCGRNEKLTEKQADCLRWQEDETLKCQCGKTLPYKGYSKIGKFGAAWCSV